MWYPRRKDRYALFLQALFYWDGFLFRIGSNSHTQRTVLEIGSISPEVIWQGLAPCQDYAYHFHSRPIQEKLVQAEEVTHVYIVCIQIRELFSVKTKKKKKNYHHFQAVWNRKQFVWMCSNTFCVRFRAALSNTSTFPQSLDPFSEMCHIGQLETWNRQLSTVRIFF